MKERTHLPLHNEFVVLNSAIGLCPNIVEDESVSRVVVHSVNGSWQAPRVTIECAFIAIGAICN